MAPIAQTLILYSPLLLALLAACVIAAANVVKGSRRSVLALVGFGSLLAGDLVSLLQMWVVVAMLRRGMPDMDWVSYASSVGSTVLFTVGIVALVLALFGSRLKAHDVRQPASSVEEVVNDPDR